MKTEETETDVQMLERQYAKYKDKEGRKAKSLRARIQSFKALAYICKKVYQTAGRVTN